jgi:hypothetical protein
MVVGLIFSLHGSFESYHNWIGLIIDTCNAQNIAFGFCPVGPTMERTENCLGKNMISFASGL